MQRGSFPEFQNRWQKRLMNVDRLQRAGRPLRTDRPIALLLPLLPESRGNAEPLAGLRSAEHTSELQSRGHLVCRLLLEIKNVGDLCSATQRLLPGLMRRSKIATTFYS